MTKKLSAPIILVMIVTSLGVVQGGPPLPLHTIEGNSGVCLTGTAYLANPAEEGMDGAFYHLDRNDRRLWDSQVSGSCVRG